MAIRQIRVIGDEILRKECKPVTEMTDRTRELIEDMFETMYEAGGVGLAAPQVGDVYKRQDLENAVAEGNELAQKALNVFYHRVVKYIGAYIAVMNGVDTCLLYTSRCV